MQIPGYVFVLIGVIVSLVSWFSPGLKVFVIAGVGFILWGLFRILSSKFLNRGKKLEQNLQQKAQEINPKHIKKEQNTVHMHPTVIACPSCGLKHYSHANYCQHCGTRIRK
jgi:hypothetical protein